MLLDIRDNCLQILSRIIQGLVTLAEASPDSYGYAKADELHRWVRLPLERGDYESAWTGVYEFLEDRNMLRIMIRLIDHVEPGLELLAKAAAQFGL